MNLSQNSWPALPNDHGSLYTWIIPAKNGVFRLRLRNGSAGFILAHFALYFSERIEDATKAGRVPDDWGYAFRAVRGYSATLSNHASGTAMDINATEHPLGRAGTFSPDDVKRLRGRLAWASYAGCIRWGGDYHNRPDEMHFEINRPLSACERVARLLMRTTRNGRRILAANPGQRAVILS